MTSSAARGPAPITCRQCGASTARQDEFCVIERLTIDATRVVDYLDDGSWVTHGVDTQVVGHNRTAIVQCDCGHEWPTTREFPR